MQLDKYTGFAIIALLMISLILICLMLILDTNVATNGSLRNRVTALEEQMIRRTKPVIQINRATIYNTEGEIVVETLDKK
ncbi:MAG: hypothetical protein MIO92_11425 [Methanosarcinaceae archaeon]|nr:hypothetical protein [Methanosarcinaceae archaeon]